MTYIIALLLVAWPFASMAATGDILYQNCTSASNCCPTEYYSTSCSSSASDDGWVRTVETSGCYSGNCVKLVGSWNSNQNLYGAGSTRMSTGVDGINSITMTQWVKFSKDHIDHANIKMLRPYSGTLGGFYASSIIPWYVGASEDLYMGRAAGKFTPYNIDPLDETHTYIGDTRYLIADPENPGDYTFVWIAGGMITASSFNGFSNWNHFRQYIKLPSTTGGSDGEVIWWVNEQMLFHAHNLSAPDTGTTSTFNGISFMPSSEAEESFEHWVDEMVIYEGYVPPSPPGSPSLSNPLPAQTLAYNTTQTILGVTTDSSAICKRSLTPGVPYSSMAYTFSTTGGTTHSQLLTGLTNGQSVPYYIRCDNGTEENTVDYIIYVNVDSGTCEDDLSFCDQTECEALTPTHYWWLNACHTAAEPVGALSFGGSGALSQQGGAGSLSQ